MDDETTGNQELYQGLLTRLEQLKEGGNAKLKFTGAQSALIRKLQGKSPYNAVAVALIAADIQFQIFDLICGSSSALRRRAG